VAAWKWAGWAVAGSLLLGAFLPAAAGRTRGLDESSDAPVAFDASGHRLGGELLGVVRVPGIVGEFPGARG